MFDMLIKNARILDGLGNKDFQSDIGIVGDTISVLPASRLGLKDRGVIAAGNKADLVLFDAKNIEDRATYEDPNQYPVGIKTVMINGKIVIEDNVHSGALPGIALRK